MTFEVEGSTNARRRLLALATGLLLVVSVAAVAVVGQGDEGGGRTVASPDGTVVGDADAGLGTGDSGAGSGGATGGGSAGRDGGDGGDSGGGDEDVLRPGVQQAAQAGRWRYRAVTRGSAGEYDRELGYVVTETARHDAVVEQRHAVDVEGGQSNDVSWRPDGQYLVATTFGSADSTSTCTWQPAILLAPASVKAGDEWKTDSSCTMDLGRSAKGNARRQATSRVVEAGTVTIDGTRVAVWVVKTESRIDISIDSAAQDVESVTEETVDEQIAPSLGLSVRSVANATTTTNGKEQESFRELTLLDVRPS